MQGDLGGGIKSIGFIYPVLSYELRVVFNKPNHLASFRGVSSPKNKSVIPNEVKESLNDTLIIKDRFVSLAMTHESGDDDA